MSFHVSLGECNVQQRGERNTKAALAVQVKATIEVQVNLAKNVGLVRWAAESTQQMAAII